MADQPDEVLWKIAAKYPAVKSDTRAWDKISKLARTGKAADAKAALELARETTLGNPRLRVRHQGAVKARARRMEFLRAQKRHDAEVADLLRTAAERMAGAVASAAGDDGTVSPGRLGSLLKRLEDINWEAYKGISSGFIALLRAAVKSGLQSGMDQAEAVVDRLRADKAESAEGAAGPALPGLPVEEADPLKAKVRYAMSSSVFKELFKGTLRKTMTAGLFGKTGVSNRVWDLRDENFLQLKRMVAGGIARGESAAKISRAIRGLLTQPATLRGAERDDARPGRGVYRSAYKNAMRLTRTETNRAFVNADTAFASKKGWQVMWHTVAPNPCPICAGLSGKKMTPEEFEDKYPPHPHCVLPGTTVETPDIVAAAKSEYDGDCVEIVLEDGKIISVTRNHPILTAEGLIPAWLIDADSKVVVTDAGRRLLSRMNPRYERDGRFAADVFSAMASDAGMVSYDAIPTTEDLHGDGAGVKGSVNVVVSRHGVRIFGTGRDGLGLFREQCLHWLSASRVMSVRTFKYRGPVYDFQAGTFGLYIANGMIVKNCLCYPSAVVPEVG